MERFLQATRHRPTGRRSRRIYTSIVGAPRCSAGRNRCDLSRGIETDPRARTITVHLSRPDPDFLHKLTMAWAFVVPAGSSHARHDGSDAARHRALPGRLLATASRRALRPQPALRLGPDHARAPTASRTGSRSTSAASTTPRPQIAEVQRGAADLAVIANPFVSFVKADRLRALRARSPGQVHSASGPDLDVDVPQRAQTTVRRHRRAAGGQPRDRPRPRGRAHRGRGERHARLPDRADRVPGLRAVLPATPRTRRRAAAGPRRTWIRHAGSWRRPGDAGERVVVWSVGYVTQHRPVLHGAAQRARLPRQAARVVG